MAVKSEFVIPFSGLSVGNHFFDFKIGDAFFEAMDYSEIQHGNLEVAVTLHKHSAMLVFEFDIRGTVNVMCDLCTEPLDLPVTAQNKLIVKFGTSSYEETDEVIFIPQEEHEVDLTHFIYEYIMLALPFKKVHPEGQCDPEMIQKLRELSFQEEQEMDENEGDDPTKKGKDDDDIDPRWEVLKNLN